MDNMVEKLNIELIQEHIQKVFQTTNSKDKSLVLVIGYMGSGKSTLCNYLCGHRMKRTVIHYKDVIETENETDIKIGHEGQPETLYAQTTVISNSPSYCKNEKQICLLDCPGFGGKETKERSIVESVSIELAVRMASKVKAILIVVSLTDLISPRMSLLRSFVCLLMSLFDNPMKIINYSIFVITNIDYYNEERAILIAQDTFKQLISSYKSLSSELKANHSLDSESIFIDCALLAVDVCVLGIFHRLYRNESKNLKSVKEASSFKINNDLPKIVESQSGIIPYAVISGNVKALSVPLRSKYFSYIQGVIQERITKEHKIRWNSFLHIWTTSDNNFQHNISSVPFGLCSGNNTLFKKSISVEVIDPLSAEELVLAQIYDDYKVHENSFTESIFGFIWGERTVGIAEVENMLVEGTALTAVGKIIIENGNLKIMPPDNEMTFFLTPLSLESLIRKISARNTLYHRLLFVMCAVSASLLIYLSRKWFKVIWRKIDHAKQLKKHKEERRLRRLRDRATETGNTDEDTNNPKCIICLENPVEILILECGHACLCLDCSEKISDHCPICRTKVQRLVSAFLP